MRDFMDFGISFLILFLPIFPRHLPLVPEVVPVLLYLRIVMAFCARGSVLEIYCVMTRRSQYH